MTLQPGTADNVLGHPQMGRATANIAVLTALSRIAGVVRVVVAVNALSGYLGNTYQLANRVPNVLFELFAAGALQAALVPALVRARHSGGQVGAAELAEAVLGRLLVILGALVAAAMVAAPILMRWLAAGARDEQIRHQQIRLGTVFLLIFLPQILCYAGGLVATSVLNAQHRFGAAAVAPVVNNVVVTVAYVAFWWGRGGSTDSLDLTGWEIAILGGGTTLAVVAFTAVPMIDARRLGLLRRPRWLRHDPRVAETARHGLWAALGLGAMEMFLLLVSVMANRIAGGVLAWEAAFTAFMLPHALFAVPIFTALYPSMASSAHEGDQRSLARWCRQGVEGIVTLTLPAAVGLMVLARPIASLLLFSKQADPALIASALRGLAPGLLGFGVLLLATRAWYALGDVRTPTIVASVSLLAGVVAVLVLAGSGASDRVRLFTLGLVYTGVNTLAAVVLMVMLARYRGLLAAGWGRSVRIAVAASGTAVVTIGLAWWWPSTSRLGALVEICVVGLAGAAAFVISHRLVVGGPLLDLGLGHG